MLDTNNNKNGDSVMTIDTKNKIEAGHLEYDLQYRRKDLTLGMVGYAWSGNTRPHTSEMRLSCFQEYGNKGRMMFRTYNGKGMEQWDNFSPLNIYTQLKSLECQIRAMIADSNMETQPK